ncbi:MAG: threonylcarbamoyl-AMP synthase [Alphaproteobacteria bacterium]|nr:threonylcarbamoyl-AMP synthase [Alphaproteobacteria bacterium]
MTRLVAATPEHIAEAAAILKRGGLVAFPTETVYGLGANALDGQAVARVYEAKGRPAFNPLIVHVPSARDAALHVHMNEDAQILADKFWPGPLTLILPRRKKSSVSDLAAAGLDTLAVRVPLHPVAQALLKESGIPLVAPSANASGKLSPTTPAHVADSLDDRVDMILAAGACPVGLESTVLDLSVGRPVILRPGAVTTEELSEALNVDVLAGEGSGIIKSPGQLLKHYAPETRLRLNAIDLEPGEALLAFGPIRFMGIRGGGAASSLPGRMIRNLSESGDLHEAAANLFAMLKHLDRPEHKAIAVMSIPETGLGVAINDRLRRAAHSP